MQETLLSAYHNEFSAAIIRFTKIWGPLPLWEYCWTGSAYNTMRLLLAQLHCPPQPPCTEILSELFTGAFWNTDMSFSYRHAGLESHKWYEQHTGFLICKSFFPLWISLHGLLLVLLLLEENFCLSQFYVLWGIHMFIHSFNAYTHIYIYRHMYTEDTCKSC